MRPKRPSLTGSYLSITGSPATIRLRMAGALARLAPRRDDRSRAIARALTSTALGRIPPEERPWIDRIEARRRELGARKGLTRASFALEADGMPSWAQVLGRPIPMSGATEMLSIPPLWGRFLIRLVRELAPRSCLELGTAFGISTAFQAAALELNGGGTLITLDAAREWGAIAEEGFARLGLDHVVDLRIGQIEGTLEAALERARPLDFAFVDAEHQEGPTLEHFETMLPHVSDRAVIVWDDIGFPRQMRRAWKAIRAHERVETSVGVGRMGIVTIAARGG